MKKFISVLLVCVLLVGSVFALASCGKTLSGTYKSAGIGLTELTFKGNKVTISVGNFSSTANYEIKENEDGETVIEFTYDEGEKEQSGFSGAVSFSEGKEDGVSYIKIAGVKYNKQ